MKYAPKPIIDAETAMEKLQPSRADYLDKREALEEERRILDELRETLAGHRAQVEAANRKVEAAIRAARGKETEEIVDLQEMTVRKERQIRTVESMIAEQAPLVELRQIDAYGARISYLDRLKHARAAAGHAALMESAEALFASKEAEPFLRALPLLMRKAEEAVYQSPMKMARHGLNLPSFGREPSPGAIKPYLNRESQSEVNHEVELQQFAAIGEVIARFMPDNQEDSLAEAGEDLQQIEPLSCEAQQGELGSGIAIAKRRKELLAELGEQAA